MRRLTHSSRRLFLLTTVCAVHGLLSCQPPPRVAPSTPTRTQRARPRPAPGATGYSFSADQAHRGVYRGRLGPNLRLLWSIRIGIFGYHNHPIVVKDRVLVSTYGRKWNQCDAGDGVHIVKRSTGRRLHFLPTRCDANGIATDGRTLYAVTDGGELHAWDLATRVRRYRVVPGGGPPNRNKLYAPPLILPAGLFVSGGKGFAALVDPNNGTLLRRFPARGAIRNHSALGQHVVFGGGDNTTWIYRLNGRRKGIWRNRGDPGAVYAAPALTERYIAVAGPYDGSGAGDAWAVLDARSTRPRWKTSPLVGTKASPAVADGVVYFSSSGELTGTTNFSGGSLHAFHIATGKELWEIKEPFGAWSSPIVAGDRIVWMGTRGALMIVRRKDGKVISDLALHTKVFATPAIAGGVIYVGGDDGVLRAIDTRAAAE